MKPIIFFSTCLLILLLSMSAHAATTISSNLADHGYAPIPALSSSKGMVSSGVGHSINHMAANGNLITDLSTAVYDVKSWNGAQLNFTLTLADGSTIMGSWVNIDGSNAAIRFNNVQTTVPLFCSNLNGLLGPNNDAMFKIGYATGLGQGNQTSMAIYMFYANTYIVTDIGPWSNAITGYSYFHTDGISTQTWYDEAPLINWYNNGNPNYQIGPITQNGDILTELSNLISNTLGQLMALWTTIYLILMFFWSIALFLANPATLIMLICLFEACLMAYTAYNSSNVFQFIQKFIKTNQNALAATTNFLSVTVQIFQQFIAALGVAADIAIRTTSTILTSIGQIIGAILLLK